MRFCCIVYAFELFQLKGCRLNEIAHSYVDRKLEGRQCHGGVAAPPEGAVAKLLGPNSRGLPGHVSRACSIAGPCVQGVFDPAIVPRPMFLGCAEDSAGPSIRMIRHLSHVPRMCWMD